MFVTRRANKEDYATIANIHVNSWGAAYAQLLPDAYIKQQNNLSTKIEMWQKIIAHPNVTVWIAYDVSDNKKEHSVGFIGYLNKGENYEITTLYILPDYQYLGIGSELMTVASTQIMKCTQNPNVSLWVLETNVSAIHFYKKHGFITNGESSTEVYKNNKIVDIKMVKSV